jgi:hypothetical protein
MVSETQEASLNYWVVGAMSSRKDDLFDTFISRGYWYCWEDGPWYHEGNPMPSAAVRQKDLVKRIKAHDRIAIKKLLGQGATEIRIRALGIVKDVDLDELRVYVDWVQLFDDENLRQVRFNGAGSSIHGPFKASDAWIREIFCL